MAYRDVGVSMGDVVVIGGEEYLITNTHTQDRDFIRPQRTRAEKEEMIGLFLWMCKHLN